jgi:hypothetical protein
VHCSVFASPSANRGHWTALRWAAGVACDGNGDGDDIDDGNSDGDDNSRNQNSKIKWQKIERTQQKR